MEIIRHPDTEHLQHLHTWLEEEEAETGEGFLCNWNVIASTYDEDRLYVVVQNGEAVALLSWRQYSTAAVIDILTVKPSLRRYGIGKLLVDAFISDMIEQQISIVKLQAVPMTSQGFWSNMGFVEDPDNPSEKINGIAINPHMVKLLHETP